MKLSKSSWQTAWKTAIAGVGGLLLWAGGWAESALAGRAILNRPPELLERYFGTPLKEGPCNSSPENLRDERKCVARVYQPADLGEAFPEIEQNTLTITYIHDRSARIDIARHDGDLTYTPAQASKLFKYLFGYRAPVWSVYSSDRNRNLPIWNYRACLGDGIATAYSAYSSPTGSVPDASVFYNPDCEATEYSFRDIRSHWAKPFIENLAIQGIVAGFPDGTYRPNAPVTRAEFAALVSKALRGSYERAPVEFADVPWDFWAYDAIESAYEQGFLSGYPGGIFAPDQDIPKVQAIVSISGGLGLASDTLGSLWAYADRGEIPDYAQFHVAGATERGIVVNYPQLDRLEPNRPATRGEIAASIYQARFGSERFIDSPYIVTTPPNPISPELQLKMVGFF